jgi:hypothetical protein
VENRHPAEGKTHFRKHYKTAAKTSKINFCNTSRAKTQKNLARKKVRKNVEAFPADCEMSAAPQK